MNEDPLDALRRTFARVEIKAGFQPGERIWWIYLRNAAIEVASRGDYPDLTAAVDAVKAFPENVPHEAQRWHELRAAVSRLLDPRP